MQTYTLFFFFSSLFLYLRACKKMFLQHGGPWLVLLLSFSFHLLTHLTLPFPLVSYSTLRVFPPLVHAASCFAYITVAGIMSAVRLSLRSTILLHVSFCFTALNTLWISVTTLLCQWLFFWCMVFGARRHLAGSFRINAAAWDERQIHYYYYYLLHIHLSYTGEMKGEPNIWQRGQSPFRLLWRVFIHAFDIDFLRVDSSFAFSSPFFSLLRFPLPLSFLFVLYLIFFSLHGRRGLGAPNRSCFSFLFLVLACTTRCHSANGLLKMQGYVQSVFWVWNCSQCCIKGIYMIRERTVNLLKQCILSKPSVLRTSITCSPNHPTIKYTHYYRLS